MGVVIAALIALGLALFPTAEERESLRTYERLAEKIAKIHRAQLEAGKE